MDTVVASMPTAGAVAASAPLVQALLATSAEMITLSDRTGTIRYASPATERVSGYPVAEFMACHPFETIHPDDRPRCETAFAQLAATPGLTLELQHRVRHKDGSWRWVEGTFTSMFDDPRVNGLLAIVRDITARKQAEEALRRAGARAAFRVALTDALRPLSDPSAIPAAALRVLAEHLQIDCLLYANVDADDDTVVITRTDVRDWTPFVGHFRSSALGHAVATLRAGQPLIVADVRQDARLADAEKAALLAVGIAAVISVPLVNDSRWVGSLGGHQRTARRWSADDLALLAETAERTGAAVERARVEAARRESEEQFRLFVTTTSDSLYSMSADWTEMCSLDGMAFLADTAQPSRTWLDRYIPADDQPQVQQAIHTAIRTKRPFALEHRVLRADGTPGWTISRAIPLLDAQGELTAWFGAASDITAHKRAEVARRALEATRQARQQRESLGVLAAGIAHEFNNLLMVIRGNAELAQLDLPEHTAARTNLAHIERAARHAAHLTTQMLAFAGHGLYVFRQLDLSATIKAMQVHVANVVRQRARVDYHLQPDLPSVSGDADHLQQMLVYLVANAADAVHGPAGTIRIATGSVDLQAAASDGLEPDHSLVAGHYVFVDVADDGRGMDSATQARMFDPFYTTKPRGRGLPLAAVVGIVRGHRGTIQVHSALGAGTTVRVLLPASLHQNEPTHGAPDQIPAQRTVLGGDDDPDAPSRNGA